MIKRTIYIGSKGKIAVKNNQLILDLEDSDEKSIPVEDVGYLILDHYAILISKYALSALLEENVGVIVTDSLHMPVGTFLPFSSNSTQTQKFIQQVEASKPLKNQLWKQTVIAKIKNQAGLLRSRNLPSEYLINLSRKVQSNDKGNCESIASRYYWKTLFGINKFKRGRFGDPPNNLLNYGYAILRSVIARAISSSGLLPIIGIHHRNKYNTFPLADDLMEPYRPFVDKIAFDIIETTEDISDLTKDIKASLLEIPVLCLTLNKSKLTLMMAASQTSASLSRCFSGESKNLIFPTI